MHELLDAFIHSGVIQSSPSALLFFNSFAAVSNLSRVMGSLLM